MPDYVDPGKWPSAGYLRETAADPWGRPFVYRAPAPDGAAFEIGTLGADGRPGGEGPDADHWLPRRKQESQ